MSQQYDDNNTGVLFKNKNKHTPKHPDYRGTINVDGVTYWISGWIKVAGPNSKTPGEKFMSLALTPQEEQRGYNSASTSYDDDVPF